jgi:hypothetical protein
MTPQFRTQQESSDNGAEGRNGPMERFHTCVEGLHSRLLAVLGRHTLAPHESLKPITWDSGFFFDDPNNRWGSQSDQLQPGDPGYTDPNPAASVLIHKTKAKAMPQQSFLPRRDWLNHFITTLMDATKGCATKYNVSATTLTHLDNGRQWVNWVFATTPEKLDEASKQATAFKNQLMTGSDPMAAAPQPPVYAAPPAVPMFASSTGHSYLDPVKPAPGTSAIHTYWAVYQQNDADFGQWSQPMQHTVRG